MKPMNTYVDLYEVGIGKIKKSNNQLTDAELQERAINKLDAKLYFKKLEYNDRVYTYNSRLAQELGYWGQTKYDNEKIHDELYKSYFINKKNVYEIDVLLNAASKAKLPQEEAKEILEKRTYKDVIDKHWEYSYKLGVTGVPTYILDKSYLVGAQQEDNFHQLFEKENIERL